MPVRGEDDAWTIQGTQGHLYTYASNKLGVVVMLDTPRAWSAQLRRLLGVGLSPIQQGDTEGALLFDPSNEEQVKAAYRAAGIRRRRQAAPLTDAQKAALSAGRVILRNRKLQAA